MEKLFEKLLGMGMEQFSDSTREELVLSDADYLLAGTGSKATDKLLDNMLTALHEYTIGIAKEQIEIAFQTAQAEVDYLHQRTSEGVRKAQAAGKQVGRMKGSTIETKKSIEAKKQIRKHSKDFNGTLSDVDCIKLIGIARNTYFKYKRELKAE